MVGAVVQYRSRGRICVLFDPIDRESKPKIEEGILSLTYYGCSLGSVSVAELLNQKINIKIYFLYSPNYALHSRPVESSPQASLPTHVGQ
jgi:hypothetical protein